MDSVICGICGVCPEVCLGDGNEKNSCSNGQVTNTIYIFICLLTVLSKCIIFPEKDVTFTSVHKLFHHPPNAAFSNK